MNHREVGYPYVYPCLGGAVNVWGKKVWTEYNVRLTFGYNGSFAADPSIGDLCCCWVYNVKIETVTIKICPYGTSKMKIHMCTLFWMCVIVWKKMVWTQLNVRLTSGSSVSFAGDRRIGDVDSWRLYNAKVDRASVVGKTELVYYICFAMLSLSIWEKWYLHNEYVMPQKNCLTGLYLSCVMF